MRLTAAPLSPEGYNEENGPKGEGSNGTDDPV